MNAWFQDVSGQIRDARVIPWSSFFAALQSCGASKFPVVNGRHVGFGRLEMCPVRLILSQEDKPETGSCRVFFREFHTGIANLPTLSPVGRALRVANCWHRQVIRFAQTGYLRTCSVCILHAVLRRVRTPPWISTPPVA